jgi:hypothetical protein
LQPGGGTFTAQPFTMTVDGTPSAAHMEIGIPVFNPTRQELMYRVRDVVSPTSPFDPTSYVVKGTSTLKRYTVVMGPVYSADGAHFGYVALPANSQKRRSSTATQARHSRWWEPSRSAPTGRSTATSATRPPIRS